MLIAHCARIHFLLACLLIPMAVHAEQESIFFEQFMGPGDLVFDIGACVGTKADVYLQVVGQHGTVICVDPQPLCVNSMRYKYKADPRVIVVDCGIGDKAGNAKMGICSQARQLSTLSTEWQTESRYSKLHNNTWDQCIDVIVITLDDLIKQYGVPQFCKLDIENFEYEALCGLSVPVPHVCFEFHQETSHKTIKCIERLCQLGFDQFNFIICDKNKLALDTWVPGDQILDAINRVEKHNRFGEPLCGDLYACCTRLCTRHDHKRNYGANFQPDAAGHSHAPCPLADDIVNEGDLVFDIGAHAGRRTDRYVQRGARVLAVEPQEVFCDIIRTRHQNNNYVTILRTGVGANCKPLPLCICVNGWPLSSFSLEWVQQSRYRTIFDFGWAYAGTKENPKQAERIAMTTLDQLIAQYGRPAYCKLCISNFEYEALVGLTTPIKYLSFEFHQEFQDTLANCLDRLYRLGFTRFNFTLGSEQHFGIPTWISIENLIPSIAHAARNRGMRTLCGEIYAWCPTAE